MKYKQVDLSKMTGISQAQISRYEKGQQLTEENIKLLATALGVSCDTLLGHKPSTK